MRTSLHLTAAAGLAVVGAMSVAASAQAAPSAAQGECTTTRGTIVAVDFGHWSGPIVRGCGVRSDGRPDASGYVLLHDGGFSAAGDNRDGPALICRLGSGSFAGGTQYPTPAQDPCQSTPPASASWSYWLAPPGARSWHYSQDGVMSDHPVAGEVQLWRFGGTNTAGTSGSGVPPDGLIDQLRAHNTSPPGSSPGTTKAPVRTATPPTAHRDGTPGTPTARPSGSRPASGPAAAGTLRRPKASGSNAAGSRGTPGSASPDARPSSAATGPAGGVSDPSAVRTDAASDLPSIVAAQPAPTSGQQRGSVLPVVIAVVVALVLVGLGGLSLLRRRLTDAD